MRLLVVLMLLVVAPDLANPLTPGAFTFDPAGSMEMSRSDEHLWDQPAAARRMEAAQHPIPAVARLPLARLPIVLDPAPARVAPRAVRTALAAESSDPAPDADH